MKVTETLNLEKLQNIVYYINNVKMTISQREELHRFVIEGILVGKMDTDKLFLSGSAPTATNTNPDMERFIQILCENCSPPEWVRAQELYDRYVEWCKGEGLEQEANTVFGAALVVAGIKKKKQSDANYYLV